MNVEKGANLILAAVLVSESLVSTGRVLGSGVAGNSAVNQARVRSRTEMVGSYRIFEIIIYLQAEKGFEKRLKATDTLPFRFNNFCYHGQRGTGDCFKF